MNQTFLLVPNQSLSIEYKQLSCVSNMKIWLIIHFITTRFVESYLYMHIIFPFQLIMLLFFYPYWRRIRNIMGSNWLYIYDLNLDRYSLMIIVLKKEMKLIFVYVYIAFLYTWLQLMNSNYKVTYFNFLRWLIEASLFPQILIFTLPFYFICMENFFDLYHIFYVPTIIVKFPLFILMRYAEVQSNSFLNELQMVFFKVFCYFSLK
jgi:hypothetical protein